MSDIPTPITDETELHYRQVCEDKDAPLYLVPAEIARRLELERAELIAALRGLYGLLQLFASRHDVPIETKQFARNHRAVDASALLARLEKEPR